jgi:hypothetical protein
MLDKDLYLEAYKEACEEAYQYAKSIGDNKALDYYERELEMMK